MAKHRINIDINKPDSIDKAIEKLEEIQRELDRKMEQFLQEIAEVGRKAAADAYGSAVTVTADPVGNNEYVISANGKAVVFLEFGAGDATEPGHRFANEMPFDVQPGSYSRENAQMYYKNGFWIFGGRMYTEVKPRHGMLRAYEAVMQEIPNVAKRVFG